MWIAPVEADKSFVPSELIHQKSHRSFHSSTFFTTHSNNLNYSPNPRNGLDSRLEGVDDVIDDGRNFLQKEPSFQIWDLGSESNETKVLRTGQLQTSLAP
jgi:hypothetical protein